MSQNQEKVNTPENVLLTKQAEVFQDGDGAAAVGGRPDGDVMTESGGDIGIQPQTLSALETFNRFLQLRCRKVAGAEILVGAAYEKYQNFCRENGFSAASKNKISRLATAAGITSVRTSKHRKWSGILILDSDTCESVSGDTFEPVTRGDTCSGLSAIHARARGINPKTATQRVTRHESFKSSATQKNSTMIQISIGGQIVITISGIDGSTLADASSGLNAYTRARGFNPKTLSRSVDVSRNRF